MKPYKDAARWILLAIQPFASIPSVMYAGLSEVLEIEQE
jgi:hypothetical protein